MPLNHDSFHLRYLAMVFTLIKLKSAFRYPMQVAILAVIYPMVKASAEGCAKMAVLQTIATTGESLGHRKKVAVRRRWHFIRLAMLTTPFRQDLGVHC